MTPAQQMMMLDQNGVDARNGKPTAKFSTRAEAEAFMRSAK